ncbi:hypothetical protein SAMN05216431_11628 [Ligilactobacillus sp. WC1T17]|uniref:CAAX prenyl protease 2/Lysostaphin resistance protein A-like domain-containing protein n=1 Tax=Ligilactobacillus ruminis TaxID=1623 RepID=A0ABY1AE64_9LACO|nr:hypothetical protein SAMN05216431_11628 [Ligilactobacillus ruminis]
MVAKMGLYLWRIIKLAFFFALIEVPQLAITLPQKMAPLVGKSSALFFGWFCLIGGYAFVIILLYVLMKKRHPHDAFLRMPNKEDLSTIVIGFVVLMVVKIVFGSFLTGQTANDAQIEELFKISFNTSLMMAFMTAIAAPIVEEMVFRGYLMDYFFTNQPLLAIILSGIVFGSAHASSDFISWLLYVSIGLVLAGVYQKSHNLAANITVHFLNNLLPSLYFLLSTVK